jgi:uncharacterized protein (DUF1800 family)
MAADPKAQAALALHRFGLGPRRGSVNAIASDPRGALLAELDKPDAGQINNPSLPTSAQAFRAAFDFRSERQAAQISRREAEKQGMAAMAASNPVEAAVSGMDRPDAIARPAPDPRAPQQVFQREAKARVDAATNAEIGFAERLVWFWSNHFCISGGEQISRAGGYEREAIRAHVLGRFGDMLLAAESHSAMLTYLDNAGSLGPKSVAGRIRSRGLNENLAREILELHTLGVRTVYAQDDVFSFAKVITGWTVVPLANDPERGGEFVFNPRMHEPGPQTVVGKSYPDNGVEQGRAVLRDLAAHPATATHVAAKLARHFIADQPPEALVEWLAKVFRDTDGDLKEVAKALVLAPEAFDAPRTKLKRPSEWVMAAIRITGARDPNVERTLGAQRLLGEPLWSPPSPKGYSDEEAAWIDGMGQRLDIANQLAIRLGDTLDPKALLDVALGPLASRETRAAVTAAESKPQGLALLLMSPEFQRR